MATQNQIEWLQKLAKWRGVELDFNAIAKMSNGELDQLFDQLKTKPTHHQAKVDQHQPGLPREFNPQRFGLAAKIALTGYNLDSVFHNDDLYIDNIILLYDLITRAEIRFKSSPDPAQQDPDQQRDEAFDRDLIARGLM